MEKITIMIADDHKLIRDTWSFILNGDPRFFVVAECGDAEEAVEVAKNKRPNIILMDINMPPFTGFEASERRHVNVHQNNIGTLVFSHFNGFFSVATFCHHEKSWIAIQNKAPCITN